MKNLLFALISFITVPILAMGTELSQLQSKLIGVWGNPNDGNAPLLFITNDYVLVFIKHNKKVIWTTPLSKQFQEKVPI